MIDVLALIVFGVTWAGIEKIRADGDFDTILSELEARGYTDSWVGKCDADSRCEYINWFSITQGVYWFVAPFEFANGTKSEAGKAWLSRFVQ